MCILFLCIWRFHVWSFTYKIDPRYLTGIDETNSTTNVDSEDVIMLKPRNQHNQIQVPI